MTRRISILSALIFCLGPSLARAQNTVVFTTNTTIDVGDTTHDGKDIIVRGCTVTIDGPHAYNSMTIERNGGTAAWVTHSTESSGGLNLTITNNLSIAAFCGIDVSARGFGPNAGPGRGIVDYNARGTGGGYGGNGGRTAWDERYGGTYGNYRQPTDFGSGGGRADGGRGGGVVRLAVGGDLFLDGGIYANGGGGPSSAGAGSGGSIWVTAGVLSGNGFVQAVGASISDSNAGCGGGGRIALYLTSMPWLGSVRADGGSNSNYNGGAGSVYLKFAAEPKGTLIFNNWNEQWGGTDLPTMTIDDNIEVRGYSWLSHAKGYPNWTLTINGDLTLDFEGQISVGGRGSAANKGEGRGYVDPEGRGCGGGYGGNGARTAWAETYGGTYGSIFQPTDFGSGGGGGQGGSGGGATKLVVSGTLRIDGGIYSNGASGSSSSGAGSGGSVWINCHELTGTGVVRADGATINDGNAGCGGGGRIAAYYDVDSFAGTIRARGGNNGNFYGGAGTVYRKLASDALGTVYVDGWGNYGWSDWSSMTLAANLVVEGGARITSRPEEALNLNILGNCNVGLLGEINLYAKGHQPGQGLGAGMQDINTRGSGGSHGGRGGRTAWSEFRPPTYGIAAEPVSFGSGGGSFNAGRGGGALKLTVAGTLTNQGYVAVNGENSGSSGGAGAGGSLWIIAPVLLGDGRIYADGGTIADGNAGCGGAGRMAIYGDRSAFAGTIRSIGGKNGNYYGEDNPVFFGTLGSSISGIVALEGFAGTTGPSTVTFEFREPGTSTIVDTKTVPLAADGSYTVIAPGSGQYDISTKVANWLRRTRNVSMASGNVTAFHFSLLNGDCDDDNEVGIGDYSLISGAFGTVLGDAGFDPAADVDWDGEIGIGDYSLLSANFGMTGDE